MNNKNRIKTSIQLLAQSIFVTFSSFGIQKVLKSLFLFILSFSF